MANRSFSIKSQGFRKIGLLSKERSPAALRGLIEIASHLDQSKANGIFYCEPQIYKKLPPTLRHVRPLPLEKLLKEAQLVLILGGDGTILKAARYLLSSTNWKNTILMGINAGRLGFLCQTSVGEAPDVIPKWLKNQKGSIQARSCLSVLLKRGKQVRLEEEALNDCVFHRGSLSRLLELVVRCGKIEIGTYRADGLLVSTPTGSTAYNLAAGGAVVAPSAEVLQVTPICPQSPMVRPLLLPDDEKIEIRVPTAVTNAHVTLDGHSTTPLKPGDVVHLKKSKKTVSFWQTSSTSNQFFFDSLHQKLNWGLDPRSAHDNLRE